jgi:methylmalonyl-CoA/ethylmalonyl-CoA epimerase
LIKKIAYIGIAVEDMDRAKETFTRTLNSEVVREGASRIDRVKNAFIAIGEDQIELMQPYAPESPVARFIERRGEGVQYIGLEVSNIDKALDELKRKGVRLTSEEPVEYPNGSRWIFVHPKAMHGVLLALIENPE